MLLVDTHAHLYLDAFEEDRSTVVDTAVSSGVGHILLPNIDKGSVRDMHRLEASRPGIFHAMIGLHPVSVSSSYREDLELIHGWLEKRNYIAIGEIGIDLYWDKSTLRAQKEAFGIQLGWAQEFGLPVAIHMRNSYDEVLSVIMQFSGKGINGVFHCFSGNADQAREVTDLGFYLGIGGVLTFKNSNLDVAIRDIPRDRILLETDAPYLAPAPHRGKRNESAYLPIIAEKLAEVWGTDVSEVARLTTENACRLFNLPNPC